MKIVFQNPSTGDAGAIVGICPHCGHKATFDKAYIQDLHVSPDIWLGQRYCPNAKCRGHIFFVSDGNLLLRVYPPSRIQFDVTSVPEDVASSLQEAIECYSHKCYRGAAVMVRRAIDQICLDKGAKGADLKKRIEELRKTVILPSELIDGMQNLRMLGNDGAHTENKVFDAIGDVEIETGIEFAKKITEAVYQYGDLLKKLNSLKK